MAPRITDSGVYVTLLEYNRIQGFIPASELSRRRIRSIPKLVQIGKVEPSVVTRVDEEKGTWTEMVWCDAQGTWICPSVVWRRTIS